MVTELSLAVFQVLLTSATVKGLQQVQSGKGDLRRVQLLRLEVDRNTSSDRELHYVD